MTKEREENLYLDKIGEAGRHTGKKIYVAMFATKYREKYPGVSGSEMLQVSSTTDLGESLPTAQYGDTNFEMDTEVLIHPTNELGVTGTTSLVSCGIIPFSHIKKISPTRVMWQIFVGENACNGETLNEIGLFSTNPTVVPYPSGERRVLCAYRYFDDINKTEAFSLLFRWTIEF